MAAHAMDNFRRFFRPIIDALLDEMSKAVRQAGRAEKKKSSYQAEAWVSGGVHGTVTEDSEGNYDIKIDATIPVAAAIIGGAMVTPSVGIGSSTVGNFLGPGQMNFGCRVVIVNASALEAGVDPSDPGDTDNQ